MDERALAVPIDVFSDVVCPWCYIGKRRLEAALETDSAPRPQVVWHAFQLNPDLPAAGVDRRSFLEEKFGGTERTAEIYERIEEAGREVGIEFDFARIERQPNTLEAHRLISWAQQGQQAAADALIEALFRAYFVDGVDIGDRANLARLAGEAGFDAAAAGDWLASDDGRAEVAASNREARRIGIQGVPFFIFDRRLGVSGAQPPAVLLGALAQARLPATRPEG